MDTIFNVIFKAIVFIILIALVVLMIVALVKSIAHWNDYKFDEKDYSIEYHYVTSGETLWELGNRYKMPQDDIREWINAVKKLNGMRSSGLICGDTIKIYVYD